MTATVESADLANAFVELTKEEAELVEALGRVTKDVDVALDNVSGAAFAARVSEALAARGGDRGSNIGVIAANPEQSKHLETATMRLCGIEVDFDALSDFTLNALFFNVHSRAIEDYTKRGWDDLRTGIMRTPLEPRVTLLDDPLRALRGVRFASRYCFALEQGFVGACLLPERRVPLSAVFAEDADDAAADSPWLLSARCVRALADAEVAATDAVDRDATVVAEAGVAAVALGVAARWRDATLARRRCCP
ncbi:CTP:tRNA cytidylyltransferase [Aureococcus anophagefferens]|nr:CTP:tRNA cytidylyltransferase [Aureococcus anophagefferens]